MAEPMTREELAAARAVVARLEDDELFHVTACEYGGLTGRTIRGMRAYRARVLRRVLKGGEG